MSASRVAVVRQKILLMRLDRDELIGLAKHFGIKARDQYTLRRDWNFGGKDELCGQLAARMIEQGGAL